MRVHSAIDKKSSTDPDVNPNAISVTFSQSRVLILFRIDPSCYFCSAFLLQCEFESKRIGRLKINVRFF